MPTIHEEEDTARLIAALNDNIELYNDWECNFLHSVGRQFNDRGTLSDKQYAILYKMEKKLPANWKTDGVEEVF